MRPGMYRMSLVAAVHCMHCTHVPCHTSPTTPAAGMQGGSDGACSSLLATSLGGGPWVRLASRRATVLSFSIRILAVIRVRFSLSGSVGVYGAASVCDQDGREHLAAGAGISGGCAAREGGQHGGCAPRTARQH